MAAWQPEGQFLGFVSTLREVQTARLPIFVPGNLLAIWQSALEEEQVKLTELLSELASKALRLRYVDNDRVEVVGDTSTLTAAMKDALREHKAEIVALLDATQDASPEHPPWWSPKLTSEENRLVDEFLNLEEGVVCDWDDCIAGTVPCETCGSLFAWWDLLGAQHCMRCEAPLKAIRALKKVQVLHRRKQRKS